MPRKIVVESRSEPSLFTLIGISCHMRDYQLTYHLNERLELGFVREDDLREFPLFFCRDENGFNVYYLLGNRGTDSYLLPDMKQADYLLLVEGPFRKAQRDRMLKIIRETPNVQMSFGITLESVKNIEAVLNELEMHLMNIHKEAKATYSPDKYRR